MGPRTAAVSPSAALGQRQARAGALTGARRRPVACCSARSRCRPVQRCACARAALEAHGDAQSGCSRRSRPLHHAALAEDRGARAHLSTLRATAGWNSAIGGARKPITLMNRRCACAFSPASSRTPWVYQFSRLTPNGRRPATSGKRKSDAAASSQGVVRWPASFACSRRVEPGARMPPDRRSACRVPRHQGRSPSCPGHRPG